MQPWCMTVAFHGGKEDETDQHSKEGMAIVGDGQETGDGIIEKKNSHWLRC